MSTASQNKLYGRTQDTFAAGWRLHGHQGDGRAPRHSLGSRLGDRGRARHRNLGRLVSRRLAWTAGALGLGLGACFPFIFDTSTLVQCVTDADCEVGTAVTRTGAAGLPLAAARAARARRAGARGRAETPSGGSSVGTTSGSSSRSTAGSTGGSSGCGSSGGTQLPARVLATVDGSQGQVWDVTSPSSAAGLIGSANLLSDVPTALTETTLPGDRRNPGVVGHLGPGRFRQRHIYLGQIEVPVQQGDSRGAAASPTFHNPAAGRP